MDNPSRANRFPLNPKARDNLSTTPEPPVENEDAAQTAGFLNKTLISPVE